jgi:CelD/BcsL family acetyltransferase involved in cellulose biosynthesis
MLRTEILTDFAELARLAPHWDRLWQADPRTSLFGGFTWSRVAWEAFGETRRLCTVVVWEGDQIKAILPLAVESGTLGFIGSPQSDYNDLLCTADGGPEVLDAALGALQASPMAFCRGVLENVPADSRLMTLLPAVGPRVRRGLHATEAAMCRSIDLSIGADAVDQLLGSKRFSKLEKRLKRLGEVSFRHLEDRSEAKAHLDGLYRQHIARRALIGGQSDCRDPRFRRFYELIIETFDPAGPLRFSVLEIAGRAVAYHFGFEFDGAFLYYKPTFDIDYWDYSLGDVLLGRLLDYFRQRGLRRFDFTIGDEAYKNRFTNREVPCYSIHLFPPRLSARVSRLGLQVKDRFKRWPAMFARVKSAGQRVAGTVRFLQAAGRQSGLTGAMGGLACWAWRRTIRDRRTAVALAAQADQLQPGLDGLEIRQCGLGDLARAVAEGVELPQPNALTEARQRLHRGDRLFLVWRAGQCVHIAWAAMASQLGPPSEGNKLPVVLLEHPAWVVYDCWTPASARGQAICGCVMARLAAEAFGPGEHWVYCPHAGCPARPSVERAGFQPRFLLTSTTWFGRFQRGRIESRSEPWSPPGKQP